MLTVSLLRSVRYTDTMSDNTYAHMLYTQECPNLQTADFGVSGSLHAMTTLTSGGRSAIPDVHAVDLT